MAQVRAIHTERDDVLPNAIAAFEHLTGRSRGTVSWVHEPHVDVLLEAGRAVIRPAGTPPIGAIEDLAQPIARLTCCGSSVIIKPASEQAIWVNGQQVVEQVLVHGDMVEFGDKGPLSRFRMFDSKHRLHWTIDDIVGDCVAYLRTSRKPLAQRFLCAARDVVRRLAFDTSIVFRATVFVSIAALSVVSYQQMQLSEQLRQSIAERTEELHDVSSALARTRNEALRPSDLAALRRDLNVRVASNIERLEALERRTAAGTKVVADAASAVAFIQGAYGIRETATGRMLRQVIGGDGIPLTNLRGQPLVTFEGNGPLAEIKFTGTGFVIEGGFLMTNRHVAQPWLSETTAERLTARGHEAVLAKLIAYLPGQDDAIGLEFVRSSDEADLAALKLAANGPIPAGLKLADAPAQAGQEIILMGYPTGLRAMLAQSGAGFVERLQKEGDFDFWNVAARLASDLFIWPLASKGIVGKVTDAAIVYDAETTHGGSGGPVLNLRGEVIAVNMAILPEFGGSNLGVPVERVRELFGRTEHAEKS